MFRQLGVLKEHNVVISARRGDGVPDAGQGLLLVIGLERDLEDAEIVRLGDLGAGQDGRELLTSSRSRGVP